MNYFYSLKHNIRVALTSLTEGNLGNRLRAYLQFKRIQRALVNHYGLSIQFGPFKGMKYILVPSGSMFCAKLLGSYENELHGIIEAALQEDYDTVINIGCGEGYYAVGFAHRMPQVNVYAFDIDPRARYLCSQLADRNGVSDRIHVRTECTLDVLQELITTKSLIFVDCEGCEQKILDPRLAPKLETADIVVELHDFFVPDVSETIRSRFDNTHDIRAIEFRSRDPSDYPLIQLLSSESDKRRAIEERLVDAQRWYYMKSRTAEWGV